MSCSTHIPKVLTDDSFHHEPGAVRELIRVLSLLQRGLPIMIPLVPATNLLFVPIVFGTAFLITSLDREFFIADDLNVSVVHVKLTANMSAAASN